MSWEIVFEGDPEDVLVISRGFASREGLARQLDALLTHPEFRPGLRVILDYTDLSWAAMSSSDVRARAEAGVRAAKMFGQARIAVVHRGLVAVGILRMLETFAGGSLGFEVEVFTTFPEARAWLRAEG